MSVSVSVFFVKHGSGFGEGVGKRVLSVDSHGPALAWSRSSRRCAALASTAPCASEPAQRKEGGGFAFAKHSLGLLLGKELGLHPRLALLKEATL